MDPLSVSMAIVGLLTVSKQISSSLSTLISKSKSAPKEMQSVRMVVDTIRSVLLQLQLLLLGRVKVNKQRTSLILIEQVVITLSACVTTFSELDVFVGTLDSDTKFGLMDRIRWATKTATIQEHFQKLEMHKNSLTLMMTILTCESTYKAEDAVDQLSVLISQVLENNQVLVERLNSIELGVGSEQAHSPGLPQNIDSVPEVVQRNRQGFAFEEVLQNSWVYKRSISRGDEGAFSAISAAGRTASWSMLSGLSLSEISIVAVQALPVYEHDLSNSEIYKFGPFDEKDENLESRDRNGAPEIAKSLIQSFKTGFNRIAPGVSSEKPQIRAKGPAIFGIPLRESINYANVAISLVDKDGKSYIYGYIPLAVARPGVFLKEKATNSENIFSQSGSAKRVYDLQLIFDSPDRYGKGQEWDGYTVYDAASLLLRYLKHLPEPVIPFAYYDIFISATQRIRDSPINSTNKLAPEHASEVISSIQGAITVIPPLHRQLLLYLLDILAVFADKSDTNLMTSDRLVAVFQPALLSREPSEMSTDDYVRASETMVFIVENQDHFLIGSRQ